ncbi:hypothetical protein ACLB2K_067511 [Fragaria x ananassa]
MKTMKLFRYATTTAQNETCTIYRVRFQAINFMGLSPTYVKWWVYVFKGGEEVNRPVKIYRKSCYPFGRERRVADVPIDHPSYSKQHAVIQFRQVEEEGADGTLLKEVKPHIVDLGSTNKTFVNGVAIEPRRYYELVEKDMIKFGNSSREYVLLHENSVD